MLSGQACVANMTSKTAANYHCDTSWQCLSIQTCINNMALTVFVFSMTFAILGDELAGFTRRTFLTVRCLRTRAGGKTP